MANKGMMRNLKHWLRTREAFKLILWFALSLVVSFIFFRDFWVSLPAIISPGWILLEHHASPWAVLALCFIFLWLKKKEIYRSITESKGFGIRDTGTTLRLLLGIAIVVAAILIPSSRDYLVFQLLLMSLGIFIIIFGKAAELPSIILAVYGFAISFPLLIERFAEYAYSRITIAPIMGVISVLGYPIQNQQQSVWFTSIAGEPITVAITSACAGPATMGVFIALFALMMLDMPLQPKRAVWLFLFGVAGTWFQSFIRLIILLIVGFYFGESALWTAHFWTVYILFPLWYLIFAYVYFRQVQRPPEEKGGQATKYMLPAGEMVNGVE